MLDRERSSNKGRGDLLYEKDSKAALQIYVFIKFVLIQGYVIYDSHYKQNNHNTFVLLFI
jgi:hypothetical protein